MVSPSGATAIGHTLTANRITTFRRKVLRFYRAHGRNLPFRHTTDPYRITVAEVMLQQTQAERVVPKYQSWVKTWPTWKRLATATDRELLAAWSGLGYNRRALYLGQMARSVVNDFDGRLPDDPGALRKLPGIGPYTARAILIFAFNRPFVAIDTNIRRVFIHEFNLPPTISRNELEELAERLLPRNRSREWHNAVMDYSRLVLPPRIPHLAQVPRQTRFAGSRRQIRGEIILQLTVKSRVTLRVIARSLGRSVDEVRAAARSLVREGTVTLTERTIRLTDSPGVRPVTRQH